MNLKSNNQEGFLVGVAILPQPPARSLVGPLSELSMPDQQGIKLRTQDSEPAYYDAGFLYLATAKEWKSTGAIFESTVTGIELSAPESIDIDSQSDLEFARLVFENYKK
jgi:CMP-N-acetylneuraminic acid synthetase